MASHFTFKITRLPRFAVTMFRDGVFVRETQHYYADGAEQAGIDWVFDQEAELQASMDRHPAGRHLRLVEDAA